MTIILFILLLSVFIGIISNIPTAMLYLIVYAVGVCLVKGLNIRSSKIKVRIFGILYLIGGLYMFLCYWYMISHNYEWLLAYDTYFAFIPRIENFLEVGDNNIFKIFESIIDDYNIFSRSDYAYYIYSCIFAVMAKMFSADLYIVLQISTLLLYSLSGIVFFLLCKQYGFDEYNSFLHTLSIFLLSIIFFYSSQIIRDIHFMLCLLLAVYLSGKSQFSLVTLIKLVIVIFIACNIRIETGLFLFMTIPVYFLVAFHDHKQLPITLFAFLLMGIFSILFFLMYNNAVMSVFKLNQDAYMEGIEEGGGLIALFQRIPVIGDLISIIYNASMPIPFWSKLDPSRNIEYGGNASNIMNLVRIPAAFINVLTYVCILYYIFSKDIRLKIKHHLKLPHRYHIWIGLLYLYLQSAVISQRRLMGYYCVFYITMFIILDNVSRSDRQTITRSSLALFALLQFVGVLYH